MPRTLVAATAATLTFAALLLAGPRPIALGEPTGDPGIASALQDHAERGHQNLSAFVYRDGEVRFGGLGADENAEVEVGSITKTFNAELLRQQIEAGEISLDTAVGELIDAPGAPVEDVTMEELVNHTSGLNTIEGIGAGRNILAALTHGNPYAEETPEDIIELATQAELSDRGERNYSNFGQALLGQLLAINAGTTYEQLLQDNILEPAGMDHTYLATPQREGNLTRGLALDGRTAAPWTMDGWAPAGAIRSTAADIAKFVEWVNEHGRPDYGWSERTVDGTEYTFHNGGTGGFRTILVWDPDDEKTAAFVANDSAAWVDDLGINMLEAAP